MDMAYIKEQVEILEAKSAENFLPEIKTENGIYFNFGKNYKGDVVSSNNIKGYIENKFGISCQVELKKDGVIISCHNINSIQTIIKSVRFAHDFMTGSISGSGKYQAYIKFNLKPEFKKIAR
jgi:hypothetical protein